MVANAERVTISVDGGVAEVRMVRADKRNALDNAMFSALADAGEQLKTMNGVRAWCSRAKVHRFAPASISVRFSRWLRQIRNPPLRNLRTPTTT